MKRGSNIGSYFKKIPLYKYLGSLNRRTKWFRTRKGRHLDLGCGNGYVLNRLLEVNSDIDVYAADIMDFSSCFSSNIKFIKLESDKLPFENNFFDSITIIHVIEHVENPQNFMREINRILKPSGQMYIECPSERSLMVPHLDDKLTWNFYDDKTHRTLFTLNSLQTLLEKENFKIINKGYFRNYLFLILSPMFILISLFSLGINFRRYELDQFLIGSLYLLRWIAYTGVYFSATSLSDKGKKYTLRFMMLSEI